MPTSPTVIYEGKLIILQVNPNRGMEIIQRLTSSACETRITIGDGREQSMKKNISTVRIPVEKIGSLIFIIRDQKVMLDRELARLYGVETKVLKQAVRRNSKRFPQDFMFQLTKTELENWRSQIVTSNSDRMGLRYPPMAFTEQGIAMLSSVLRSDRAIEVNIAIMRTFVKLRSMLENHAELARKIGEMEIKYDTQFQVVFEAIHQLATPSDAPRRMIGFTLEEG